MISSRTTSSAVRGAVLVAVLVLSVACSGSSGTAVPASADTSAATLPPPELTAPGSDTAGSGTDTAGPEDEVATVPAATVAQQAEEALEEEVGDGADADLDCGTDDIDLVEDTVVDCVLTDLASGLEYDTAVTIDQVDGPDYHLDVEVSQESR